MKGESSSWSNVTGGFFPAICFITVWGWQDTKIINCLWFVTSIGRFAATWISIRWECNQKCQEMQRIFLEVCKFHSFFQSWLWLFNVIRTLQLDQWRACNNLFLMVTQIECIYTSNYIKVDAAWSSGWVKSWIGLLLTVSDVLTTCAVVIFSLESKWVVSHQLKLWLLARLVN